jgi:leader peptidase (prepilin peptidase)/N-methyltransferase
MAPPPAGTPDVIPVGFVTGQTVYFRLAPRPEAAGVDTEARSDIPSVRVKVTDGFLTLSATGGTNTKIDYVSVDHLTATGAADTWNPRVELTAAGPGTSPAFTGPVTVTADTTDLGTGVASVSSVVDSGAPKSYTGPVTVNGAGSHTVVVTATDLSHRIVPNVVVVPAAVVVLVLMTAGTLSPEWAIGAVGASGFLLVAALAYPGGMGMGDVKLALLMGAALGRVVPVALFLGMLFAIVPSIVLFVRHGARARKMAIPFAPFLALGTVVALFAGPAILHAWLHH